MGKIADALEKAKGRKTPAPSTPVPGDAVVTRADTATQADRPSGEAGAGSSARSRGSAVQGPVSPKLVVFHQPASLAAENFKVLRSQLLYPKDGEEKRVVLVTSALEQEGKTFVACNLAISIAQGIDPYVLLIDADTRNPNVHRMLGVDAQEGLSDYLQRQDPLSRFLVKTPLTKLTILPAGTPPRNPAELLTSTKMAALLKEAKARYSDRFIILDSPPVNLAAEALTLAKHVDTVIFVVRYGKTSQDVMEQALEKIGREKILGLVFNGFEVTPRKYSYYKKRYSYPK